MFYRADASALTKSSLAFLDLFPSVAAPPLPATPASSSSSPSLSSYPNSSSLANHHDHPALATAAANFSSDDALDQFARMQRQQQRLSGGGGPADDGDLFDDASADLVSSPSLSSSSARHPQISAAEAYAAASRATTPLQDDLDELDRQVRVWGWAVCASTYLCFINWMYGWMCFEILFVSYQHLHHYVISHFSSFYLPICTLSQYFGVHSKR